MLQVHFLVEVVTVCTIFFCFQLEYRPIFWRRLQHRPFHSYGFCNVSHHVNPCHSAILGDSSNAHPAFCYISVLSWGTRQNSFGNGRPRVSPIPLFLCLSYFKGCTSISVCLLCSCWNRFCFSLCFPFNRTLLDHFSMTLVETQQS